MQPPIMCSRVSVITYKKRIYSHSHTKYQLSALSQENHSPEIEKRFQFEIQRQDYTSMADSTRYENSYLIAARELTYIDGKAFVRAHIRAASEHTVFRDKTYYVEFNINETHSYGEHGTLS